MLQPVEIFPTARDTVRRGVSIESTIVASRWDQARVHRVLDLSDQGMRVAAGTRLEVGEDVLVSFVPPGWWLLGELEVFARVKRSTERQDGRPATMGLEFLDLPRGARAELRRSLRGVPPPIPTVKRRSERQLVWVDVLVTCTEDLDDRVNTYEVREVLSLDEAEIYPAPS